MLTTAVECDLLEREEDYTPVDVETKAKQLVEAQCVKPIKKLTEETSIPYIVISGESMMPCQVLLQIIIGCRPPELSRHTGRTGSADL